MLWRDVFILIVLILKILNITILKKGKSENIFRKHLTVMKIYLDNI